MSHKIAKLILEQAGTFLERTEAVKTAVSLGMPLQAIEEYLDWLDLTRPAAHSGSEDAGSEGGGSEDAYKGDAGPELEGKQAS